MIESGELQALRAAVDRLDPRNEVAIQEMLQQLMAAMFTVALELRENGMMYAASNREYKLALAKARLQVKHDFAEEGVKATVTEIADRAELRIADETPDVGLEAEALEAAVAGGRHVKDALRAAIETCRSLLTSARELPRYGDDGPGPDDSARRRTHNAHTEVL